MYKGLGLCEVGGLASNFYAIEQVEDEFPTNFGKPLLGAFAVNVWLSLLLAFNSYFPKFIFK